MKEKWFEYILNNRQLWPKGVTHKRLLLAKESILNDRHIMYDLLDRHGCRDYSPEQLEQMDKALFEHAVSNFASNIALKIRELLAWNKVT